MNSQQTDTGQNEEPQHDFMSVVVSGLVCGATGFATLLAWWLPAKKPQLKSFSPELFALGRYSYFEFLIAVAATGLFVSIVCFFATPPEKRRRTMFRLLAICLGGTIAISIGEVTAMLLPPKGNPFYTFNEGGVAGGSTANPRLPYVRIPNMKWEGLSQGDIPEWLPDPHARRLTFQTDSQGFRNSQELKKADLIFIGDSFTEGGNVAEEETFVRRTAVALNSSARNLGLFGYSPQAELVVLEEYGIECRPQVVVWQICEGNDLSDALGYASWEHTWEQMGRPGRISHPAFRHNTWSQRSPTFLFFQYFAPRQRFWLEGTFRDQQKIVHPVRFSYWPVPSNHYPLGHPKSNWGAGSHPGWQAIVRTITRGKQILNRLHIKLLVLFIPMKITAMGDLVEYDDWSKEHFPAELKVPAEESMGIQLGLACDKLGIPYVDTTEKLLEAAKAGELVFLPFDTHISPRGHEIVSELLTKILQ